MNQLNTLEVDNDITVSVICITYNHEKYIHQALDSFVSQKTDFRYEIIVHDDASTDGTADIIREFEKKYPHIIKPIYQKENQYSKNPDLLMEKILSCATGKYTAISDGDDYWTDENKLQIQYEAMERHPEIDICAHLVRTINAQTGENTGFIGPMEGDKVISVGDVIRYNGGFVGTSSLFMRTSMNKSFMSFQRAYMLDYTIQIRGALRGGMLYLGKEMSAYRQAVKNSWVYTIRRNPSVRIEIGKKLLKMYRILDCETNGKYKRDISYIYRREVFKEFCYRIYRMIIKVFGYHGRSY